MLDSLKRLPDTAVHATDGEIGRVARFLIDVDHWVVRYLVVDTGDRWQGQEILISPMSIRRGGDPTLGMRVSLDRAAIMNSPTYDASTRFTREDEARLLQHYGYPRYWTGPFLWGPLPAPEGASGFAISARRPMAGTTLVEMPAPEITGTELADSQQLLGIHLQASDGDLGHVDDFLADGDTWRVRYLVIDSRNWWLDRHLLIAPEWIDRADWQAARLHIALDRTSVKGAPEYDGGTPPSRRVEAALYRHHRRPPYWSDHR